MKTVKRLVKTWSESCCACRKSFRRAMRRSLSSAANGGMACVLLAIRHLMSRRHMTSLSDNWKQSGDSMVAK